MLKAILFDLDDTLIDWSQAIMGWPDCTYSHLEKVFNSINKQIPSVELEDFFQVISRVREQMWSDSSHTLKAPQLAKLLSTSLHILGLPPEFINEEQLLIAYDWQPVKGELLFPDVHEALSVIQSYNLKTAVVTNSSEPMWMRDIELARFDLLKYFPHCRTASADVGFLKPHPSIFEVTLSCLNVNANEAVFIGDNPGADIVCAQQLGIRAVLRLPKQNRIIAQQDIADGVIESLHELFPLLDGWYPNWRKVLVE